MRTFGSTYNLKLCLITVLAFLSAAPLAPTPEKAESSPKTPDRSRKGLFSSSPKKEIFNRRHQEKERAALAMAEVNAELPIGSRQRSMTLPSRVSQSLASADPGDASSLPRGRRSRSRNRQDPVENGQSSPPSQPRGIGGLTSALQVGSRLVSSLRRRTSLGQEDSAESSPATSRHLSVPNNQQANAGIRPTLSRQDGDGSDGAEQQVQTDKAQSLNEPPK